MVSPKEKSIRFVIHHIILEISYSLILENTDQGERRTFFNYFAVISLTIQVHHYK